MNKNANAPIHSEMIPNKTLRVGYAAQNSPYRYDCGFDTNLRVTASCKYPGIIPETLDMLFRLIGMNFELIDYRDQSIDVLHQSIHNGTIDIATYSTSARFALEHRNDVVPYVVPGWSMPLAALGTDRVQKDMSHQALAFLFVYGNWVWLACVFSYFVICAVGQCIDRIFGGSNGGVVDYRRNSNARTLLVVIGGLFVVLFTGLYKNGLLSNLVLIKQKHQFENFDEFVTLVQKGGFQVLMRWTEAANVQLAESTEAKKLQAALRANPPFLMQTFGEEDRYRENIASGQMVLLSYGITPVLLAKQWCNVRYTTLLQSGSEYRLLMSRYTNPEIVNELNSAIYQTLLPTGLIMQRYLTKNHSERSHNCESHDDSAAVHSLQLVNVFGTIGFLLVGLVVATVVLVVEIVKAFLQK